MAVLEKIRVKLGIFITALIAIALLSFIIDPDTLQTALSSFSSKYDVGKIDGKSVSYNDYQKRIDYFTNIYNITTGGQSIDEKSMETLYDQAWQDMIAEMVILPKINKAGIYVGDEEMVDLTQGRELSPVIANEPAFMDQNRVFSRANLINFIQAIPQDQSGGLRAYWDFLEKNIQEQQLFNKYISLIAKSDVMNDIEKRRSIEDNNVRSTFDFVVVPFGYQVDSTVTVSQNEIKEYYNKNKEQFKQSASRDIEYAVFEVVPSTEDFNDAKDRIDRLYDEFTTATNLRNFLARNSDTPLQNYFYKEGELESISKELEEFAFKTKSPKVLPVLLNDEMYMAARINATKSMSDSAYVQHILLSPSDTQKADSLVNLLNRKRATIADLALEHSLDQNPNSPQPGDIGWMTQTMMIQGMDTVLTMATNKPVIINTQYGLHIVNVKERTKPVKKVQLAILSKEVVASRQTFQTYYSQANSLASRSEGKYNKFSEITNSEDIDVVPAINIAEGSKTISKYENMKEVSRWIYDSKLGEVSPVITIDNKYFFVVAVTNIKEEGYMPLQAASQGIDMMLRREKTTENITKEIGEKIAGMKDLQSIADALNVTISKDQSAVFGSMGMQTIDPVLIGAVSGAPVNEVSGAVKGNIGVYVFEVTSRDAGSYFAEDDAKNRKQQQLSYQINSLPIIFNEMAGVKDNRAKFF